MRRSGGTRRFARSSGAGPTGGRACARSWDVSLPGVPLAPGRADGPVHLPGDRRAPRLPPVVALRREDWPPGPSQSRGARGFVVEGEPHDPAAAGPPAVGGLDLDLFREGETVRLDGDAGTVIVEGTQELRVVTAFVERVDHRILLLRRSAKVGSFQGRWAAVSGYLEDPTPLAQAERELREETGLAHDDLELRAVGRPVLARDERTIYVVHPFRFGTRTDRIQLDWEHTEAEWVLPAELRRRATVPKLERAWEAVAARPKS